MHDHKKKYTSSRNHTEVFSVIDLWCLESIIIIEVEKTHLGFSYLDLTPTSGHFFTSKCTAAWGKS